ncbi:DUF1294 domain-containing protein [Cupriavidus sp. RAF12]|uniref:DUF1294 domain-containing protein n=1 Tax=Cupriavidus sp. RAF12 TaxID=3233050 RepID=UPI003F93C840
MKKAGRVKSWNAKKGYGFIDVHADLKDIFFHVTALQNRSVQPKPGDHIMFELAQGKDGRPQAIQVSILGAPRQGAGARQPGNSGSGAVWLAFAALAAVGLAALGGFLPKAVAIAWGILSVVAFITYFDDKQRASRNARRVPEANLHMLALLGGWPGALIAQQVLRHKNRKRAFQTVFRATVALNVGALVLWKLLGSPLP